jgi:hypothetical protein
VTALRVLVQSAVLAAAACALLYALALALPTLVSDPVLVRLQHDTLDLLHGQPWLLGLLWAWVAACLVVARGLPLASTSAQPTQ